MPRAGREAARRAQALAAAGAEPGSAAQAAPISMGSPSAVPVPCSSSAPTAAAGTCPAASAPRMTCCCDGPLGAVRLLDRPSCAQHGHELLSQTHPVHGPYEHLRRGSSSANSAHGSDTFRNCVTRIHGSSEGLAPNSQDVYEQRCFLRHGKKTVCMHA